MSLIGRYGGVVWCGGVEVVWCGVEVVWCMQGVVVTNWPVPQGSTANFLPGHTTPPHHTGQFDGDGLHSAYQNPVLSCHSCGVWRVWCH